MTDLSDGGNGHFSVADGEDEDLRAVQIHEMAKLQVRSRESALELQRLGPLGQLFCGAALPQPALPWLTVLTPWTTPGSNLRSTISSCEICSRRGGINDSEAGDECEDDNVEEDPEEEGDDAEMEAEEEK
ncbi:unnamed protein product [Cuscuta campestris]|uniref:Uncharacterized protein n=1 Tax=Cuscuta campestris TaxID=132261 RepID=A0A484N634_9ASTE|nr:unnamed protein product [Cuscuta campestris]